MRNFLMILTGVLLNAGAQIALKQGMRTIGYFSFSPSSILAHSWRIATNPYVLFGLGCYVVSVCVWLLVLSRVEVSFAYPMLSIGYIVTALFAFFVFGESLTPERVAGICLIIVGVYLISKT